jgi:hypothetical protein
MRNAETCCSAAAAFSSQTLARLGWLSARMIRMRVLPLSLLLLLAPFRVAAESGTAPLPCDGPLAQRLVEAALAAPSAAQQDGTLYGVQRWQKPTGRSFLGVHFPGLLSCAYTVSAIFQGACHPIGRLASVRSVDAALADWRKITRRETLKPGDVVFWQPSGGSLLGLRCPNDHWHVGILIGAESTIDNDWWSGLPAAGHIERPCMRFAYARRPPD